MKKVIIIGGGASGLISSIIIKRNLGNKIDVTILERLDKVGKKILATGNGRCNFTNIEMTASKYNAASFVDNFLEQFGYEETISFFNSLGLISKTMSEGRVYPVTENASTVLDVLRLECERLDIKIRTNFEVKRIIKSKGYIIEGANHQQILADYLVVATGGSSSKVLGSNGSGYQLLSDLGVKITKTYPGLVGLKTKGNQLASLDGIRTKALLKIKIDENLKWQEAGEVLFKKDGLSGIVSMQASSYINRHQFKDYIITLDILEYISKEELKIYFRDKIKKYQNQNVDIIFIGLLNRIIGYSVLKQANIELNTRIKDLTEKDIAKIIQSIKNFIVPIYDTYDFDKSQVTIGGVAIEEVKNDTLELNKYRDIYVAGELLDIDGECGGYNLQWAWTSGAVIGMAISEKERGK